MLVPFRSDSVVAISLGAAMACAACHRAASTADAARADARADGTGIADANASDASPSTDAAASDPAATAPTEPRVTITAMGDIYLPRRIADAMASHREEGGLLWVLSAIAPVFADREIAFADLETPLTTSFRPPGSGLVPVTGVPGVAARALARAGLDVIQLANNHAYDQAGDGLDETLQALHAASVPSVGAGRTDEEAYGATVIEREGLRVAFVAFTERTNDGPGRNANGVRVARIEEPERALAAVTAAREHADFVVAGVHWSRDFVRAISDRQRQLARLLVDAGADLVVGTGPHLLQRV
ncbi:MAG: CapA family protein, partial [Deltaproteobacteria bacterium]